MRLALGAVAPTPRRIREAEDMLVGEEPTDERIAAAAEEAARRCQPISDVRASAQWRREVTRVLARRALTEAAGRAG